MNVEWVDDELVSKGRYNNQHVATVALDDSGTKWFWSTWTLRNTRLDSGEAETRDDAKFRAVRIGLHPRNKR